MKLESIFGTRVPAAEMTARRMAFSLSALLMALAAVLLIISIFTPYWKMTLLAPQYPKGLVALTYVNRLEGDIQEIDTLNHYIGMRPLGEAASFEKSISIAGIVALSLLLLSTIFVHTRWAALLALPALLFPALFLGDLAFWLNHFGQNLDPRAPLSSSIQPFTPPVLGRGGVAQFNVVAEMDTGLILACIASLFIIAGLFFHRRAYKPLVDAS